MRQKECQDFSYKSVSLDFENIFPKKVRTSNGCGPDGLSGLWLSVIWRHIKPGLECLLHKNELILKFPKFQDADQRIIAKGTPQPILPLKKTRPIGNLNLLLKFLIIKPFISWLRDSLMPVLDKHQYALPKRGLYPCVARTYDNAILMMKSSKYFFLNAYDFSNAFCLWNRRILCSILATLGFSSTIVDFVQDFLINQSIIRTDFNNSLSCPEILTVGSTQGQIGSDLLFLIIINFFSPLLNEDIYEKLIDFVRSRYMDDTTDSGCSNDLASVKSSR